MHYGGLDGLHFSHFLTGLILFYQITARIGTVFWSNHGTFMMLNVWGIIWRNQKNCTRNGEGDVADAAAKAGLASRTNTLFSVPMFMLMVYSAHGGSYMPMIAETSMKVLWIGLAIIFAIEANALFGKMNQ